MRVFDLDTKSKRIRLRADQLEDLYWLTVVVENGDLVTSTTTRRVKMNRNRRAESKKVAMRLTLTVKKVQIDPYSQRLRISGIVREGPEKYFVRGRHHTINAGVGSVIELKKLNWHRSFLGLLKRAETASYRPPVILLSLDKEGSVLAVVTDYRVEVLFETRSNIPPKGAERADRPTYERSFFKKLADSVEEIANRKQAKALIVGGPGLMKRKFLTYLSEERQELSGMAREGHASTVTVNGIYEMIRRGEVDRSLGQLSITLHSSLMDEFLTLLSKNRRLVAYGLEDVKQAVRRGASKVVVILNSLLFSEGTKEQVIEVLDICDETRAEFHIVDGKSEPGGILKGFGGMVSILRYPL